MTEATIRSVAKALAEKCYEMTRMIESMGPKAQWKRGERALLAIEPDVFGKMFPTVTDYLAGLCHGRIGRTKEGKVYHIDDGSISQVDPGWMHFVQLAKAQLAERLGDRNTPEHRKEQIFDALREEWEKNHKTHPSQLANITQRKYLQH